MNVYYAKTVLYAYMNIDAVKDQIDELVEKRALSSMSDFSPAIKQCERIINLSCQKILLDRLKTVTEDILYGLSDEEKTLLDYKYFKSKPKDYYNDFDTESRTYFRHQIKVAEKFARSLSKRGYDDAWFEQNLLSTDFFKELLKRVIEHEKACYKNKPKTIKKEALKKSA